LTGRMAVVRCFDRMLAWFVEPVEPKPALWGHSGGWGGQRG
jgi:hypothetical protein